MRRRNKPCSCGCGRLIQKQSTWSNACRPRPRKPNTFKDLENGTVEIIAHRKKKPVKVLIDKEDLEKIILENGSRWYVDDSNSDHPYALSTSYGNPGEKVRMHRAIVGAEPGDIVDHINHDTLDNRKSNLRVVSASENAMNRRGKTVKNKSGVRNVYWCKERKRYVVHIRKNGKIYSFGRFKSLKEAAEAAENGRKKLFGEFKGGS